MIRHELSIIGTLFLLATIAVMCGAFFGVVLLAANIAYGVIQ